MLYIQEAGAPQEVFYNEYLRYANQYLRVLGLDTVQTISAEDFADLSHGETERIIQDAKIAVNVANDCWDRYAEEYLASAASSTIDIQDEERFRQIIQQNLGEEPDYSDAQRDFGRLLHDILGNVGYNPDFYARTQDALTEMDYVIDGLREVSKLDDKGYREKIEKQMQDNKIDGWNR
ncbi:MAG: hypothetical protein COV36_02245 [Alphaproteobacteria bacterium CG11_big_fil_rev_8_21_14_0_20_44_7]|nr:MAG: hypothetical protein COV36_02245 [Alphaproteobacteria bacterium CG11_big_fil_rev_8_21_14_0_20_44_7]